ncbi:MAG: SagB/ThcOx family dehydrogenase [Promethearchaeota archaeon]
MSKRPPIYKEYNEAMKVTLPSPETSKGPGLWDALSSRCSVRVFSSKSISKKELSQLLWATQGITKAYVPAYGGRLGLRTAPSAGALYPIETYVCVNNVKGIEPGIYHYSVESGDLELIREGELDIALANASLDQRMLVAGNVVFIWSAVFDRSKWKYHQRAFRYVFLDAGHIAQNLALAAEGSGMGTCQVAAFYAEEVNQLLHLDGNTESAIYLSVVGKKK